ncbi:MAG: GNAT family N-acetyltransferase [bacterium]
MSFAIGRLDIIEAEQEAKWQSVIECAWRYDFYYLPGYHLLAEKRGEGKARLFVYTDGKHFVALPLLIRPVEEIPGLEQAGSGLYDATSVYGYAGPVRGKTELTEEFLDGFRKALHDTFKNAHIVAVFSRLHPLIEQEYILQGLGECPMIGQTVSIDLTIPSETQFARYRKSLRKEIKQQRRMGITCKIDSNFSHLNEFISIYREAMLQINAPKELLFDREYFHALAKLPGIHLFVCTYQGEVLCGALTSHCDHIIQAHLSATHPAWRELGPSKLMHDEERIWGNTQGASVFHLGGGRGAREDTLFLFKAGFSDRRHEFRVWRWVVEPGVYERLCRAKEEWNRHQGLISTEPDFFPAYRSPTRKG